MNTLPTESAAPGEASISKIPILATRWERLGAHLIDLVIVWVGLIFVISSLFFLEVFDLSDLKNDITSPGFNRLILSLLVQCTYFPIFTAKFGATPGKMLLRMKVVSEDYQKPSIGGVLLRELLGRSCAVIFIGQIGNIWIFFNKRKQTAWDYLAKTVVVKI